MLENATYSVLSPEGFASILWKDGKRAKEASEVMKITAHDLYALNIVEQVIPEYGTADEKACESISRYMKGHMKEFLERQNGKTGEPVSYTHLDVYKRQLPIHTPLIPKYHFAKLY